MPKTLPTPVAAALGLVPTVAGTARKVPAKVVQLPILAVSTALTRWAEAQQRYDDLAERGERLVAQLRGQSSELDPEQVQEWLSEPIPVAEDEAPDPVAQVTDLLDRAAEKAPKPQRHDTAATPEVVAVVEEVAASFDTTETASHDELPLPDYDHMTLGSLRGRLRSLTVEQLVVVRDYEKAHADRLPVITLLDNRIAKLTVEGGEPSAGGQLPVSPEPAGEGKVTAAKKAPAKRTTRKVRIT